MTKINSCKGCHTYTHTDTAPRCDLSLVKRVDKCPCRICLIKGICTTPCDEYEDFVCERT